MPADDLILNIEEIISFPFSPNAGFGDAVLLQNLKTGNYYQMSAQGLVASALQVDFVRGLGVGATLPIGAGGNVLAAQGFVAPSQTGILFNCFMNTGSNGMQTGLTYLAPGSAGELLFDDAGFSFLGFPSGDSLHPVLAADCAATLSRTGDLAVRNQITVGRAPVGPNELVTLAYFNSQAITRNPGNDKLNLTTQDIVNAGGATMVNAALSGYPTAEHPVSEASGHEIATAGWVREWGRHDQVSSWNGQRGDVCLTLFDIVYAGGAQLVNPQFGGTPRAPTPDVTDSSTIIATTAFVHAAIAAAMATLSSAATTPKPEFPL